MLAWEHFNGEPVPRIIEHIQDRDLWKFELEGTREIQAALFSYVYDFEVWDRVFSAGTEKLRQEGEAIERKHFKDIDELLEVCERTMEIGGFIVPVASLPYTLVSDAAHKMADGAPFAACYWDTQDTRIFGLRSTDQGEDVSAIAKLYGGGGHRNAAGFSVPRDHHLAQA
jgi:oligoribonuclease NrnB/cAMP/cGMP phosphodiesterase (DHH superfamily)